MRMNRFFHVANASLALMVLVGGGGSMAFMACSSGGSSSGAGGGAGGTPGVGGKAGVGGTPGTGGTGGNPFTGSKVCNDYITGGDWDTSLTMGDFSSEAAFTAYDNLNTCACMTTMANSGCEDLCSQPQNGTTTNNFCNGVAALSQCQFCLNGTGTATGITTHCEAEYTACTSN